MLLKRTRPRLRLIVIDLEACSTVTDLTRMGRSHSKAAMRDYEPQSDAATWRMLASATGMAAALSFGRMFAGTIVSAPKILLGFP